ncbi:MAG: lipoprotein insertase outer membrane protein LolB [Proteobacteria bacterium]|nr:lipoprotein insertase outer membrane protein LolB [Pseudomonadota bacterium]MDA0993623.1 lipoprotein insertase outer membrane protein LolB [Pseudomonadota bacterium]
MLRSRALNLGYLVLLFWLTGCTSTGGVLLPDIKDWESRKSILINTDEWEFAGRIGVSAGDEGFNGKLWWRQDGTVFRARISGPLGVGTIFINGDRHELTLTDQDGVVTELVDAEIELRERFGWTIPVTSLRYWALGIPDPSSDSKARFNDAGLLSELAQRNWQVAIAEYTDGGGQSMPRRLTALNEEIKLRLVIDSWTFR